MIFNTHSAGFWIELKIPNSGEAPTATRSLFRLKKYEEIDENQRKKEVFSVSERSVGGKICFAGVKSFWKVYTGPKLSSKPKIKAVAQRKISIFEKT